jgi:hypothetical protein
MAVQPGSDASPAVPAAPVVTLLTSKQGRSDERASQGAGRQLCLDRSGHLGATLKTAPIHAKRERARQLAALLFIRAGAPGLGAECGLVACCQMATKRSRPSSSNPLIPDVG